MTGWIHSHLHKNKDSHNLALPSLMYYPSSAVTSLWLHLCDQAQVTDQLRFPHDEELSLSLVSHKGTTVCHSVKGRLSYACVNTTWFWITLNINYQPSYRHLVILLVCCPGNCRTVLFLHMALVHYCDKHMTHSKHVFRQIWSLLQGH